jgi:Na+-transporting NADH:ubiquinone oxidoreductase subunit A
MNSIHLKKGLSPKIAGAPSQHIRMLDTPRHVGMVPERIPFIKPRLLVEENDVVSIGSPLFEDKRNPRIRFVSPGGGQVTRIAFGPRRIIQNIIITLDDDEKAASVDVPKTDQILQMSRSRLVEILLAGGMWPFLRVLPFMDIADPDIIPPAVIVRLGDNEPFGPTPSIYLEGREKTFAVGIDLLKALCDRVVINITGDQAILESLPQCADTQQFTGNYPSGHPGYQLYRTKKGPEQNRTWYIDGQEVALLGEFIHSGSYPTRRIMSVGGSLAPDAGHVDARAGAPLRQLCAGPISGNPAVRYIVGGVFSGFTGHADSFMGFYQNALNVLDEGDREEFLGFIRPGYGKPSNSTAFLSAIRRRPFPMDCGQHGEIRACVNCGYCAKVCPVDILPQFTMKCLVADEVEEALAHGLLDCIECGLCTYVCPSKIELREALRKAKAQYYKETA